MNKKNKKRGGGESVSKKQKGIYNIPNFLTDTRHDLTLSLFRVKECVTHIEDELDFIESLIEENK